MKNEVENINLKVNSVDDFYSGFSDNGTKIVYKKIVDYINDSAKASSPKTPLNINIKVKDLKSKEEMTECADTLRFYYKNEIDDIKQEVKTTTIIAMLLLAVGIGILLLMEFLIPFTWPYFVRTLFEIMAWAFVWETVDLFFFRRTIQKLQLRKLKRIYNSNINIT